MNGELTGQNMGAYLEEKAQQLFLLSDQERKGFIVKRDMQVSVGYLVFLLRTV